MEAHKQGKPYRKMYREVKGWTRSPASLPNFPNYIHGWVCVPRFVRARTRLSTSRSCPEHLWLVGKVVEMVTSSPQIPIFLSAEQVRLVGFGMHPTIQLGDGWPCSVLTSPGRQRHTRTEPEPWPGCPQPSSRV